MSKVIKHPLSLFILTSVLMFLLVYFYRYPQDYTILIAGAIVLLLSIVTYGFILFFGWGDEYLFIIVSMLVILGVAMLYRLDEEIGFKQIIWYGIGIIIFSISYLLYRYFNFWKALKWFYVGLSIILFVLTLIIGETIGGARNWISIGGFMFQPSEFIKLMFIFYLSCYFGNKNKKELKIWRLNEKIISNIIVYIFLGFLILQREWGSTMLFLYLLLFIIFNRLAYACVNLSIMSLVSIIGYFTMNHIQIHYNWLDHGLI